MKAEYDGPEGPLVDAIVYDVPIDELIEYPGNPRRGDVHVIAASLKRNGQFRPVVVWRETGQVLAGNHTVAAARSLGWTTIKATYVEGIDEREAARIVLADNRSNDAADYSTVALVDLLDTLDGDLAGSGYSDFNYADLVASLDDSGPAVDGDVPEREVPEAFQAFDDSETLQFRCPKCRFEWDGSPR